MARACRDDLPDGLSEIFLQRGLDDPNQFEFPQQIRFCAQTRKSAGHSITPSARPRRPGKGDGTRQSSLPVKNTIGWSFRLGRWVMENLTHYPLLVFAAAFAALWFASVAGSWLRRRDPNAADERNEDIGVILAATLTLLALIIGFSFSMATNRYDQRKNFEEAEANAIGTEILRADLLPPADAATVRKLLGDYLDQRILFYSIRTMLRRTQIDQRTSQLQADLWAAVRGPAAAQPTPVAALVLAGMNDVINSQSYSQAAFWNRIPAAAWCSDGDHRAVFKSAVRLSVAKRQKCGKACSRAAVRRFDCLPSDRRYRCSAAWLDRGQTTEPGKFGKVAWALSSRVGPWLREAHERILARLKMVFGTGSRFVIDHDQRASQAGTKANAAAAPDRTRTRP